MLIPKFTISQATLKNIASIEASREVIDNAPLIPQWEARFKEEAIIRTVHYGTKLEGNDMSMNEARKLMAGQEVIGRERDIQEILNYRRVVEYIDRIGKPIGQAHYAYTLEQILQIHKLAIDRLVPEAEVGKFRQVKVTIRNEATGEVVFSPPPAGEVPYLLASHLEWLNSVSGREVFPVLRAGIVHYTLAAVHPFTEGNGRMARAMALLVMFMEGYDVKKLFSPEEYYDRRPVDYYQALKIVSDQSPYIAERDLTPWLEFFTLGLAVELTKIKEQVRKLSLDINLKKATGGKQVALSVRQIKLFEYVRENRVMTMSEARKILPEVSDDTILRDLQVLREHDLVTKKGQTKGAKYHLKL